MARLASTISLIFLSLLAVAEAKEFIVGGKESKTFWRVPAGENRSNLNYWAEQNRFRSGDALVWNSVAKSDSVLEVSKKDYDSCTTTNPIKELKADDGKFTLDRSGPFYFISGVERHCKKGQKLEVVVLADKHENVPLAPAPATEAPAPAPEKSSGSKVGALGMTSLAMVAVGLVSFLFL
ncbi:unnamed protein product [Linum tenue]|uniref:Phytocyanin domain-containing protein n=1 Tax=Linum tenue TaxID=586396 RepID=A0AAV0IAW9_9ROSI|nr:unnamed protein product [Linum tenue]